MKRDFRACGGGGGGAAGWVDDMAMSLEVYRLHLDAVSMGDDMDDLHLIVDDGVIEKSEKGDIVDH